ncbi:MAG TPA: dTDP-glucose 4,6-dehydratase [Gemmatimonadales bacterium]|nr:dTDP-glucose 4,6-dehydratase [Gemmatimonadales bacterium]
MEARRLLVTGGAGFIGSNFVQYWLPTHPSDRIVVLDALTYAGNPANLTGVEQHPGFTMVHGDIRTPHLATSLLLEHEIDIIVHFAAETHVDRSIEGPDAFLDTNVRGTHELLKAAREAWLEPSPSRSAARFHHISTDEVYGSLAPEDPPFTETSRYSPSSPYAASKVAADHLVRAYRQTYGLPVSISNCSNNYGPFQLPEKLIPLMLVNILEGKSLPVYGDGLNVRDWLYVEDHCRAIDAVIARACEGETYNVAGRNEWRTIDIVRLLCRLTEEAFARDSSLARRFEKCPAARGDPVERLISFVPDRPGHDRRYAMDAGKIDRDLGFSPRESFESGIRKTLAWYLTHEAWWRPYTGRRV